MPVKNQILILLLFFLIHNAWSQNNTLLVVAQDGSGDYVTISEAVESLPMYCYYRVTIFIKNGVYNEKIKIDRDYITLIGEDRQKTRIEFSQLRQDWINNKDNIGPAVVNIFADDVIIKNLTIENTQSEIGPHAFAIYGTGTRTILSNCNVLSKGGDTVSLWNYKTGMYYHDSCYFQGAVDFVCPRGWCYISNSAFFELKNTAALWHAAPTNPDQKFVLKNCTFQGADSFYLARHHYDAQFYFLNCSFPAIMRDKEIEHVLYKNNPEKNRPYLYGDRCYFYNCSREAGNYKWFSDNLSFWPKETLPDDITPKWTFEQQWNPVDTSFVILNNAMVENEKLYLWFSSKVMAVGELEIKTASGINLKYINGSGRERLEFAANENINSDIENHEFTIVSGNIQNIVATVKPRIVKTIFVKL